MRLDPQRKKIGCRKIGLLILLVVILSFLTYIIITNYLSVRDQHSGTATIAPGESFDFMFHVYGDGREIAYRFDVISGPRVDIFMLTPSDYERYNSQQEAVDRASWRHLDIQNLSGSPYPGEGDFWAVIDNTDYGLARPDGAEAVVNYSLSTSGIPGSNLDEFFVEITILLAIMGLIGLFFVIAGSELDEYLKKYFH